MKKQINLKTRCFVFLYTLINVQKIITHKKRLVCSSVYYYSLFQLQTMSKKISPPTECWYTLEVYLSDEHT